MKGISNALLYKNADSKQLTFFATYDLSSLEVLATEDYKSLSKPSQHTVDLMSRIQKFERRDCQVDFTHQLPGVQLPAKYVLAVSVDLHADGEEAFKKWYREDMERVSERLPGWLRGRIYKCSSQKILAGQGHTGKADTTEVISYISIHEFDRLPNDDTPENKASLETPRMQELVRKYLVGKDRRVFELYKIFESPKPE